MQQYFQRGGVMDFTVYF